MHPHIKPLAAAFALLAVNSAWAEEKDLGVVVVTATRTATQSSAIIGDVSTVSRTQIEQAAQSTLGELLQTQPGVQITANGGPGSPSAIYLRGGSSTQTLVLVDGLRLASATAGSTAFENIPLEQIERIEILRGPASALYGSDAIGGVIQIFTRQGSGMPHFSLEAGAGTYGTQRGTASYAGKSGDTRFNFTLGVQHSDGFSATKPGAFGFNGDRDAYDNRNFSVQLAHQLNPDHELGAQAFYSHGKAHFDAQNCDAFYITCTSNFDNTQQHSLSSASAWLRDRFLPNWTSQLRLGQSRDDLTSVFLDPSTNTVSGQQARTRQNQLSWQNDIDIGRNKLLLAVERREENVDANTMSYTIRERTTDALVAGYQAWVDAHSVQLSARHDRSNQYGSHDTGSFAYAYQIAPAWRASAALATAFRAPTFNDLYWPVDYASYFVGNPNLRPERARNREIGLVHESGAQRVSITAYRNQVSDLIGYGNASAPDYFFTTVNVGSALLKGLTTSYDGKFGPWQLKASYDVLSAHDETSGLFLMRRAKNHGALALRYAEQRWDAGVELIASGARWADVANTSHTAGYGLLNVDGRLGIDRDWSLVGRVNNLLNRKYELLQDYNTPGANLFLGVRYAPK